MGIGDQNDAVPPSPSTILTSRLTLTPLREDDAEAMVGVLADKRMYEFTGGQSPTVADLRARYRQLVVGHPADRSEWWFNWVVRMSPDMAPVGAMQATVTPDGRSADVAWEIGVPWQGRGLASEAADAVVGWLLDNDVAVVQALVHPDHLASAAVAARAGLARTSALVDGEVVWRRSAPS